jgi:hypothetical protein
MLTDDDINAIARRWAERYQEDRDSEYTLQEDPVEVSIADAIKEALRKERQQSSLPC